MDEFPATSGLVAAALWIITSIHINQSNIHAHLKFVNHLANYLLMQPVPTSV